MNNEKKHDGDAAEANEHEDMPVQTPGNDIVKNTAAEPGLNAARNTNNELEPGTKPTVPHTIKKDGGS